MQHFHCIWHIAQMHSQKFRCMRMASICAFSIDTYLVSLINVPFILFDYILLPSKSNAIICLTQDKILFLANLVSKILLRCKS